MTTQVDDTEGAESIETQEAPVEDVPLPVAPMDKPATEMALAETHAFKVPLANGARHHCRACLY